HLLPLLDGTRDRSALVDALLAIHRENPFPIELDGSQVSDEAEMRDAVTDYIDALPRHLADMKLLRVS
ncbi:MAG TPA: hypothetical protein VFC01_05390, partial [Mycobacterium sp.]|nr:hypothetical protein [Mycobacterium sp.]